MWLDILYVVIGLVIGLLIGFFLSKYLTKKYMKENPPINEDMVRTMMSQMGRTPSQKQVNQVMKSFKKQM
ncbi:MAG: YneF family protein [Tenericutes bacterium]|jgi:uncharacterized protein YneF (UPF0154 family)|nr:YneF family protein [Bacilli bacterium]MDD3995786.1 YneF family protein [Bacilli bacterium]MDD4624063.1 YneF family protein [Bacilli bacterium]MDD4831978.1 YneF family protein [Bacilli bacterium]NLV90111.1 YneF family protein [Mycoplasmatota bacterium]